MPNKREIQSFNYELDNTLGVIFGARASANYEYLYKFENERYSLLKYTHVDVLQTFHHLSP
jgi:hypothetical protein